MMEGEPPVPSISIKKTLNFTLKLARLEAVERWIYLRSTVSDAYEVLGYDVTSMKHSVLIKQKEKEEA
jgi:hypothetical protein